MFVSYFGTGVLLAILFVSARSYDHRDKHYAAGKTGRIDTPASFAWVYRYVQVTTAVFGLLAFTVEHPLFQLHRNPSLVVVGSLLALGGLWVFVSAKSTLGRHYSPCFDSYLPDLVVREGLYRSIRHPIYTGNFVILAGLTVATGSPWIALNLLLVVIYYNISARTEESVLAAQFDEYPEYLRASGRFFPRLRLQARPGRAG